MSFVRMSFSCGQIFTSVTAFPSDVITILYERKCDNWRQTRGKNSTDNSGMLIQKMKAIFLYEIILTSFDNRSVNEF